jgi:transcriptional regulator MraZ
LSQFLGTHQNRLDAKGRISVPAPFRAALKSATGSAVLILRPSMTKPCIDAVTAAEFDRYERALDALDPTSAEYEDRAAALYASAHRLEPDADGRIMLPASLIAHAGLGEHVAFMGIGRSFQIWAADAVAERLAEVHARAKARAGTTP